MKLKFVKWWSVLVISSNKSRPLNDNYDIHCGVFTRQHLSQMSRPIILQEMLIALILLLLLYTTKSLVLKHATNEALSIVNRKFAFLSEGKLGKHNQLMTKHDAFLHQTTQCYFWVAFNDTPKKTTCLHGIQQST